MDTNFFVALYNPADSLHKKALQVAKLLKKNQPDLIISIFVFLETITVLSQRVGRDIAIKAGQRLLNSDHFTFIQSDEDLEHSSWKIFQEINKKNISFVDCSIIAILNKEKIPSLLTFDIEDFKLLSKKYKFSIFT